MPLPSAPTANLTAPALVFNDGVTSFGELKALTGRCAASLTMRGIGRGDIVALQMPKRRVTYALLLACLRLGAPYVFLDPKNPPERSARIIERVRPTMLFSEGDTANPFGQALRLAKGGGTGWLEQRTPGMTDGDCSDVTGIGSRLHHVHLGLDRRAERRG